MLQLKTKLNKHRSYTEEAVEVIVEEVVVEVADVEVKDKLKKGKGIIKIKMRQKIIIGVILVIVLLSSCLGQGKYDNFAQCLVDSEIKLYSAWWCSHCTDQKKCWCICVDVGSFNSVLLENGNCDGQGRVVCRDLLPAWQ